MSASPDKDKAVEPKCAQCGKSGVKLLVSVVVVDRSCIRLNSSDRSGSYLDRSVTSGSIEMSRDASRSV